jgi:hypothetical protein
MPLPNGTTISMSQVNTELSRASTATISLGETAVRNLAGVPSGAISMSNLWGKSAYTPMSLSYTGGIGEAFGPCQTVSASATVSVANGVGPFSYVWTRTSGSTSPTSASSGSTSSRTHSLTASLYLCPNGEASSTYSVVVTDSTNATASINVLYNLLHFGN